MYIRANQSVSTATYVHLHRAFNRSLGVCFSREKANITRSKQAGHTHTHNTNLTAEFTVSNLSCSNLFTHHTIRVSHTIWSLIYSNNNGVSSIHWYILVVRGYHVHIM